MPTVGIICEYNPLHRGHEKQFRLIREHFGSDTGIVCLMSGNFVQRGAPAIFDKSLRAKAAVLAGADLVLELPVTAALSSAEGFAAGGVKILGSFCDYLCFGAETSDADSLLQVARTLTQEDYRTLLLQKLESGCSFPAARQQVLTELGHSADLVSLPNNILAVEYCKAILETESPMQIFPICRQGSYHAQEADRDNPSATAVRKLLLSGESWEAYVPQAAAEVFRNAPLHALDAGERAILARLRTMSESEFESLPYGSEGLWRKFMHACRKEATLEQIIAATKSKRYTRTRLDRMMLCAFLGITKEMLSQPAPYVRALAFSQRGRTILRRAKESLDIVNAGERREEPYFQLERRCGDLYGLFALQTPDAPSAAENSRIFYSGQTD